MGTLYYGDNLDILRRHLKDESVDHCAEFGPRIRCEGINRKRRRKTREPRLRRGTPPPACLFLPLNRSGPSPREASFTVSSVACLELIRNVSR
jgi:hypothetical protein